MRSEDLSLQDLLRFHPAGGLITFAGQRALLLDSTAMGSLHQQLVQGLGVSAARAMLAQVGYAYGWWLAETLKTEFEWDTAQDWVRAGPRICMLGGLFCVDTIANDSLSDEGCTLHRSYEARQHLLHFGRADEACCWTLCGLQSGYLSHTLGEAIFVTEDRCVARGDAACHFIARNRAGWPARRAAELFCYSRGRLDDCLDLTLQQILSALRSAERTLRQQRLELAQIAPDVGTPGHTIAQSAAMAKALEEAVRVAKGGQPVLLTGECGVGKQRIARLIHERSGREQGPFVVGHCGNISELLLASELFGHAQGAFDEAAEDRVGLFEAAHHGTLMLDEVAEAPLGVQAKVLRLLETGELQRLGESQIRKVDVRLIAATSRRLTARASRARTPSDILRRLQGAQLYVPALRERREDILPLARMLLAEAALSTHRRLPSFSPAVVEVLLRYPWPGNVRELEEAMLNAVAICDGDRIEAQHLPIELHQRVGSAMPAVTSVRLLDEVEREYILASLERNKGNQTRTARQLGIGTATLYRKLRRYA